MKTNQIEYQIKEPDGTIQPSRFDSYAQAARHAGPYDEIIEVQPEPTVYLGNQYPWIKR
jgi:hypothetical protein